MIRVYRAPIDTATELKLEELGGRVAAAKELERVTKARSLWKSNAVARRGIRRALDRMSHGIDRCMYCGDNEGSDIDHYDPLARAPLKTFDWSNHLLACSICNSHNKRGQFPTNDRGEPLLIDPSNEDPFEHLLLTLSLGIYKPLSERGQSTIDVCGLNSRGLPQGRMHAKRVVTLALRQWWKATSEEDEYATEEAMLTVKEQPLADVFQSMLRQSSSPGAHIVFRREPDLIDILQNKELRAELLV